MTLIQMESMKEVEKWGREKKLKVAAKGGRRFSRIGRKK